jgi:diguanylate cyclase (GGDEF)-like protein/hemerythrin-like metal-binding protein
MEPFIWDKHFITGLAEIDDQHRRLVDMINQFGEVLTGNQPDSGDLDQIFNLLANYAQYHFSEEEALMHLMRIDKRHLLSHLAAHFNFLQELNALHRELSAANPMTARNLFEFLTQWLAYHILGADQNMARQLRRIHSGSSSAQAYADEEREQDSATQPLLRSLNRLFEQVAARNRELTRLNQSLEAKVAERTMKLSEANQALEILSLTDMLSELPNRRHGMRCIEQLWQQAVNEKSDLGCLMLDADNFKSVNDTYGHDAGDAVIVALARTLRHAVRNDDIVCRLGGDEFLIICPGTNLEGAMYLAELVRQTVSGLYVPTGDTTWRGSVSIGVAACNPDILSYEDLIKAADQGVYLAKAAGRNCVRSIYSTT